MKKFRNYHLLGFLLISIYLLSNQFGLLPDILEGLCLGTGFVFILIGMYTYNNHISKIRNWKIDFLKKHFKEQ